MTCRKTENFIACVVTCVNHSRTNSLIYANFKTEWLSYVFHGLHREHSMYFTITLQEDYLRSRAIGLKIPYSIPRLFPRTNLLCSFASYYWIV